MYFDEVNELHVTLAAGELESKTRAQLLAGQNAAVIGEEVIQFRDAEYLTSGTYILRGLLRGRLGTEHAMSGHVGGERFMLLDENKIRTAYQTFSQIDVAYLYKPVTVGSTLQRTPAQSFTNSGIRRKPLAPFRFAGGRNGSDDLLLKWKPRSRFGIRWEFGVDNASGESVEKYAVYIPNASAPLRVLISGSPEVTYTAAMQTEDYGAPQPSVECEVCQVSPEFGLGYFTRGTF